MSVETASYISQLNPSYPAAGDLKSEGDDHMRLIKGVLQTQFPNLGANAVTPTAAQLNNVANAALRTGDTFTGTHDFTGATINVPTQSATDNDTSAASTAFVQSAILASSGISATLPAQTGNSGKFLTTNGTSASWAQAGAGLGGQTITGNVTLTASSGAAITVTPANPGLYATLPDATTCSTADNLFAIYNAGDYDYGVKDSTGTQLGWVRARTGAMIGLSDKSTAAGVWAYYGLEKTGITASYVNSTLANMGGTIRRIALDANRTCFLFGGADCYAIVYDATPSGTTVVGWGAAALVRSSIASGAFLGVLSATNQVLVVSNDSTTAMEAVTLTIAASPTNTITVNTGTKGTATLAGNLSSFGQLIAVSTSWVVSYARTTTTGGIRAITVSGTTPTIGGESAVTTSVATAPTLFASGSIVRTVVPIASATTLTATPYTVSGSTLSVGTAATATITGNAFRAFLNGNGNIVCHYINTTHFATIFKLTGTTEAASSVSIGTVPTSIATHTDYVNVTASKTVFVYDASSTNWYANILTDTAGTASVGTETNGNYPSLASGVAALTSSGNNARFFLNGSSYGGQITLDCSGSSPVLSSLIAINNSTQTIAFSASDSYGVRLYSNLLAGSSSYSVNRGTSISFDLRVTAAKVEQIRKIDCCVSFGTGGVVGAANNESYAAGVITGTNGFAIQRIEAAA